jgi:hypothetical protein
MALVVVLVRAGRTSNEDDGWPRLGAYSSNILYAVDLLASALTGGDARETISSRAGKGAAEGKLGGRLLCRFLSWLDPGHCQRAVHEELGGRALWRTSWRAWALAGLWVAIIVVAVRAYC